MERKGAERKSDTKRRRENRTRNLKKRKKGKWVGDSDVGFSDPHGNV